jgi:hypothetical protein
VASEVLRLLRVIRECDAMLRRLAGRSDAVSKALVDEIRARRTQARDQLPEAALEDLGKQPKDDE